MRNRWMCNSLPCEWTSSKAQRCISDKSDIIRDKTGVRVFFTEALFSIFCSSAYYDKD